VAGGGGGGHPSPLELEVLLVLVLVPELEVLPFPELVEDPEVSEGGFPEKPPGVPAPRCTVGWVPLSFLCLGQESTGPSLHFPLQ
jgi:hypothetical protein